MSYIIEERRRGTNMWRKMCVGDHVAHLSKSQTKQAVDKMQAYFGLEYEYRVRISNS